MMSIVERSSSNGRDRRSNEMNGSFLTRMETPPPHIFLRHVFDLVGAMYSVIVGDFATESIIKPIFLD